MAQALHEDGGLRARLESELRQEACDVVLDRLLREVQVGGDLPVREALGDEFQDPLLLVGQRREFGAQHDVGARQACPDTVGVLAVEQRLPRRDALDGVDEVRAPHLLEDVPARSREDRCEEGFVVVVGGEDEAADVLVDAAYRAAHLHAGAVGQTPVENGHVGACSRDAPHGLVGAGALPHHLAPSRGGEQVGKTPAHDLVVVEQVDANSHAAIVNRPHEPRPRQPLEA